MHRGRTGKAYRGRNLSCSRHKHSCFLLIGLILEILVLILAGNVVELIIFTFYDLINQLGDSTIKIAPDSMQGFMDDFMMDYMGESWF